MVQIIGIDALGWCKRGDRGHGVTERIVQPFQSPAPRGLAIDLPLFFEFFVPAGTALDDRHREKGSDDSFHPR